MHAYLGHLKSNQKRQRKLGHKMNIKTKRNKPERKLQSKAQNEASVTDTTGSQERSANDSRVLGTKTQGTQHSME